MVKLSIIVAVYNHERYIEQAIKSILQQKVNFEYEVIIGEDCSKDGSQKVLKQIEKDCPSNFKFIYREKNLGAEGNFQDLYARMRGEYFIVLEGDDYWLDPNKLQNQVDFLDRHKDYIACAHHVRVVDEYSKELDLKYPECEKTEYSIFDYERLIFPGQTATVMSRNYITYNICDTSILNIEYYAGDQRRYFMLAANGKIYCFPNCWSAYRYNNKSGESFSATIRENAETHKQDVDFRKELIKYSKKIKNTDAQKVAETLYILSVYGSIKFFTPKSSVRLFLQEFNHCKYKMHIIIFLIKYLGKNRLKRLNKECK